MRFLCLHGLGTNSQVLEIQTSAIRFEMDRHHTFEFVEGTVGCAIASEIKSFYPATDAYYQYYDDTSAPSAALALSQLHTYVSEEGPFDGVLGFSQGACLAATYLVQCEQQHVATPFKCAIFFSCGPVLDPQALAMGKLQLIDPTKASPLIKIPTVNIWASNDTLWPGQGKVLTDICEESCRSVYVHGEGHGIPGAGAKEAVQGSVRAIRRGIDQALMIQ